MGKKRKYIDQREILDRLSDEVMKFGTNGLDETGIIYGLQKSIEIIKSLQIFEGHGNAYSRTPDERKQCRYCKWFRDTWQQLPSGQWGYKDACAHEYGKRLKKNCTPYRHACIMYEDKTDE